MSQSRVVLGTCGHVDHGKTRLVQALTGIDTDRLAEEKRRGITIELGFAPYRDAQATCALVDVPGHQAFIHHMLAGAAGMDAVLLVVAADEGVCAQTVEHVQICQLLGIKRGLIALTRCDLVEADLRELVSEDIQSFAADTFLADAEQVPVSVVSGMGVTALRQALARLIHSIAPRSRTMPFRMPLDRVFAMKGFGTVVTGTVTAGTLRKGQSFMQYPAARVRRARGMQVHGESSDLVQAGERAALNLAQVTRGELARGDQLAAPDSLMNTRQLLARLTLLPGLPRGLDTHHRVRLHLGAQQVLARVVLLEKSQLAPGDTQLVKLKLEGVVATRRGDRLIVRHYSPLFTMGGGEVIDPGLLGVRRRDWQQLLPLLETSLTVQLAQLLRLQGLRGLDLTQAAIRTGTDPEACTQAFGELIAAGTAFCADAQTKSYLHHEALDELTRRVSKILTAHHADHPTRLGMSLGEFFGKLKAAVHVHSMHSERSLKEVLEMMCKTGQLVAQDNQFRLPRHQPTLSQQEQRMLTQLTAQVQQAYPQPPRKQVLLEACQLDARTGEAALQLAVAQGVLVRVKPDLYYTPAQLERMAEQIKAALQDDAGLTVIAFKEMIGLSRKHAVDVLEYFDSVQFTLRLPEHRILRQNSSGDKDERRRPPSR